MRRRASIVEHPRARRAASAPTAVTPRLGCSHRGPWLRRTARRGVRMVWDGGEDNAGLHSSAGQFGRGLRKCPCGMLPGVTRRVLNTKKNVRSHQSRRARTRKQKHVDRWGRSRGLTRENLPHPYLILRWGLRLRTDVVWTSADRFTARQTLFSWAVFSLQHSCLS